MTSLNNGAAPARAQKNARATQPVDTQKFQNNWK